MLEDFLIQLLGFIGIALGIIAVQFNTHKNIVLFKTLAEIPYLIQYIFLNAYVGMVMGVVGIIRNIIFTNRVKQGKDNKFFIILFSLITVIVGCVTIALSWEQTLSVMNKFTSTQWIKVVFAVIFSALSIIAKIFSTIAYGIKEPKTLRALNLPASFMWFIYNLVFFSISGVLHELFLMSSIIIAMIRYKNTPLSTKNNLKEIENQKEKPAN